MIRGASRGTKRTTSQGWEGVFHRRHERLHSAARREAVWQDSNRHAHGLSSADARERTRERNGENEGDDRKDKIKNREDIGQRPPWH